MTIKDIAKLAGVSVSSVSKIINGKDESIGRETREKVLRIVKEYNYVPYSFVESSGRSFLIGALLRDLPTSRAVAAQLASAAEGSGYHIVLCQTDGTAETARAHFSAFTRMHADAIVCDLSEVSKDALPANGAPLLRIGLSEGVFSLQRLYGYMARQAADALSDLQHTHIACLVRGDAEGEAFAAALERRLYERQLPPDTARIVRYNDDFSLKTLLFFGCTAVVCADVLIAAELYRQAQALNVAIPRELSVIAVNPWPETPPLSPTLTVLDPCFQEYAKNLFDTLVGLAENTPPPTLDEACTPTLCAGGSIAPPRLANAPGILVIGAMNVDVYVSVDEFPYAGHAIFARPNGRLPGGKAVNQAIAAVRMGANVRAIGKIGSDDNGRLIYNALVEATHQRHGILVDFEHETGAAYVLMRADGESSVIVHTGANDALTIADVHENEDLFTGMQYCLLQTEMAHEKTLAIAEIAKAHSCRVILKPCAGQPLSNELLALTDYLLPTNEVLCEIFPGNLSMEQRAEKLRARFSGTLIITRAEKGCYVTDNTDTFYCSALNVVATDVIGASDAFIGVLAVRLGEGLPLREAVVHATYAAGYSVINQGVVPSLIDRNTLEALLSDPAYEVTISDKPLD